MIARMIVVITMGHHEIHADTLHSEQSLVITEVHVENHPNTPCQETTTEIICADLNNHAHKFGGKYAN